MDGYGIFGSTLWQNGRGKHGFPRNEDLETGSWFHRIWI